MTTYSISRLNTFLDCPWRHWCKYIAGYKEIRDPERTKYMDRGTIFHLGMEILGKHKGELELEPLKLKVLEEIKDKDYVEEAITCGLLGLDRYFEDDYMIDASKIIETENQVYFDLPNGHQFTGIVDAVIQNDDGTVTLVDYKTVSQAPKEEKYKYGLQANMYMYVYDKLGYKVRDFKFAFVNPAINVRTKKIVQHKTYIFNQYRAEEFFNQFVETTNIIEANPDYRLYRPVDRQPDAYDYLYYVFIGDMLEDLDDFIEKNFEKSSKKG